MNSLQKQSSLESSQQPETFVSGFERQLLEMGLNEVELTMKKLKFLGSNFDPFSQDITTECQQIMEDLSLTTHMHNPYQATNILLRLLDKTEERINNLKQ